jgi:gamma-glutamylcyclotransferase (GGCT)/AIG2-like uncharacterized protein YtfP
MLQRAGIIHATPATAGGTLFDLGDYPGMVLTTSGTADRVRGELVRFANEVATFSELDAEEAFNGFGSPGSLFRRTLTRVHAGEVAQQAWVYVFSRSLPPASRRIHSGDWRAHRAAR